jgi:hypothetical protein
VVAWRSPRLEVREAADLRRAAEGRAAQLEARQARALRSLALDPQDEKARQVLLAIEAEIAALGLRK